MPKPKIDVVHCKIIHYVMCSRHFWNAINATDFHGQFIFAAEHIAHIQCTRWDFRHMRRKILYTIDILLTASRGTLRTKSAAHVHKSYISSANRHAWLYMLAQQIDLVCARPKLEKSSNQNRCSIVHDDYKHKLEDVLLFLHLTCWTMHRFLKYVQHTTYRGNGGGNISNWGVVATAGALWQLLRSQLNTYTSNTVHVMTLQC